MGCGISARTVQSGQRVQRIREKRTVVRQTVMFVCSWYIVLVVHKDTESEFQKMNVIVIFMLSVKAV